MEDPKALVEKISAGDTKAFQILIEQYQRLVSHIVFRMIRQSNDREDICQEVFIQVYQNLGNFKFESKLSTWIARIAYNRCINYLEKKKTPLFDDLSSVEETLETFPGDQAQPDDTAETADLSSRLQIEIERMPIQFRTILTLYHLEEMKYNEIAEILQLPEGTVKNYLFRARKKLKERLLVKYQMEELV